MNTINTRFASEPFTSESFFTVDIGVHILEDENRNRHMMNLWSSLCCCIGGNEDIQYLAMLVCVLLLNNRRQS